MVRPNEEVRSDHITHIRTSTNIATNTSNIEIALTTTLFSSSPDASSSSLLNSNSCIPPDGYAVLVSKARNYFFFNEEKLNLIDNLTWIMGIERL